MPRVARRKGKSGIYHIMMRGINRQQIFIEKEDNTKFIATLLKYKEVCGYELYAYCLMGNHIHLLLKEGKEALGIVMRKICSSYVLWYNKKYDRIGYLFQDRFKSEPVEDKVYFLTVLRYIFQNPIRAGMVNKIQDYRWSNFKDYMGRNNYSDIDFVLGLFHIEREKALKVFTEYINMENNDSCLDINESRHITDDEAIGIINNYCNVKNPTEIRGFEVQKRNNCLKDLRQVYGLSIRQIERLTGLGRGIIQRA